jgi:predicted metalloprotease with PDZ domain
VGAGGEGAWFAEGVSRYVAMNLLAHIGLLTPDEVREAVAGELSVMATSPHRALGSARLAELAGKDDVARATLMARGALYALREAATLRARTKGQHGLVDALIALLAQADAARSGALPTSAWLAAVGKDDPDAERTFDAQIVRGEPSTLPPDALGPCFRAGSGDYVAFDPGFDLEATSASPDGRVIGVRADGPAAKAGLKEGDRVESMQSRDGDATVPIKLAVARAGSKLTLSYLPRGARGRGQTWSRLKVADERCGELP